MIRKLHFIPAILLFLLLDYPAAAQDSTAVNSKVDSPVRNNTPYKLTYKKLIAPAVLIGFGVASLKIDAIRHLNFSTKNEIVEDKPHKSDLDNYSQYAPAVLVYGLNAAGVKGRHNFKDMTIIYATSQLIAAAFVTPLKHIVKEERPDGSNNQSFPSGHTATAFSSA